MRDEIPHGIIHGCGVLNLDDSSGPGTHWTAWYKNIYFDSFGLPPPEEFLRKTSPAIIKYNDLDIQKLYDPPFCGHLCLAFIDAMASKKAPIDFFLKIYRPL